MSKRQLRLYLTDMLQAIGRIERYLSGLDRDAFLESDLHLDAVTRNLEILGEAARHLPEEIKSRYPEIPWRPGGGFAQRGGPPHQYFAVDPEVVWTIAKEQVPTLKETLQRMLQEVDERNA
ncbi:HepT-like ribonuclease domain-containing protein [Thermus antranikianii]